MIFVGCFKVVLSVYVEELKNSHTHEALGLKNLVFPGSLTNVDFLHCFKKQLELKM